MTLPASGKVSSSQTPQKGGGAFQGFSNWAETVATANVSAGDPDCFLLVPIASPPATRCRRPPLPPCSVPRSPLSFARRGVSVSRLPSRPVVPFPPVPQVSRAVALRAFTYCSGGYGAASSSGRREAVRLTSRRVSPSPLHPCSVPRRVYCL